jgi:LysM repeat protein
LEKGEFLGTIAENTIQQSSSILEWNSLSDTNIKQGDKLIVGKEVGANLKTNQKQIHTTVS